MKNQNLWLITNDNYKHAANHTLDVGTNEPSKKKEPQRKSHGLKTINLIIDFPPKEKKPKEPKNFYWLTQSMKHINLKWGNLENPATLNRPLQNGNVHHKNIKNSLSFF